MSTISEVKALVQSHFSCSTSTKLNDSDVIRRAVNDELRPQVRQATDPAFAALRTYSRLVKSPLAMGLPVSGNEVHLYLCVAGHTIEELYLDKLWTHCRYWSHDDTVMLLKLLPIYCPKLKHIYISKWLSDEEVIALAEALPQLEALEALTLKGALRSLLEENESWAVGPVGGVLLKVAQKQHETVPRGATMFFRALSRLPLKHLDLSHSSMRPSAVVIFLNALKKLSSLETLQLHGALDCNGCSDLLADAIGSLSKLTSLDMCQCWLRDAGALALASVLNRSSNLRDLRLGNNKITKEGLYELIDKVPPSLTYLDVSNNCHGSLRLKDDWDEVGPDYSHCFERYVSTK